MALFNIRWDLAGQIEERKRREAEEQARQRVIAATALRGAGATDEELARFRPGQGVDPLQGVRGLDPRAELQSQLRAEELNTAMGRNADDVDALRVAMALADAGANPSQVSAAQLTELRRQMLREAAEGLDPAQRANAANRLDVSPYRSSGGVTYDRFGGATQESAALQALAAERQANARLRDTVGPSQAAAYDALAAERQANTRLRDLRAGALEDLLGDESIHPLLRGDIANQRATFKGQTVKVRQQDGTEAYYVATPNLRGGVDYQPATADGEPLVAAPGGSDGRTALQKDTAFIAETLQIPAHEAILFKLQSKSKRPEDLWSDIVLRVKSGNPFYKTDRVLREAEDLWGVIRPNEAPPMSATSAAPAPSGADGRYASAEDVRQAYESGGLSREEAMEILRRDFGYQ